MRPLLCCLTALCLLACLNSSSPAQRRPPRVIGEAARRGWMSSYRAALEKARAANKPLMVVFRCVP